MTVPIETSEVEYTGNGATDTFSTGFYFLEASELRVYLTPVGGSPSLLVEGTDYTVTMPASVGANGSIVVAPAPAVGEILTVRRTVPITQLTNFRGAGTFSPAVHEDQFDQLVFIDQQLDRRIKALESAGAPGAVVAGDGLAFVDPTTLAVGAGAGITVNADTVEVDYGGAGAMVQVRAAAASAGVQDVAARIDHRHDVMTSPPGAGGVVAGGLATEGTAQGLARADHTHQVLTAAPVAVTKSANVEGVAGTFARSDHKHDVSTAAAVTLTDASNAEGSATSLARSDHTHSHGARGGGTLHAEATTSTAGFMSAADKTKLDSLVAWVEGAAKVETTDATPTELLRWTPTNQTAEFVEIDIAAKRDSANEAAGYRILATVTRFDGVTRIVNQSAIATHEDVAGWAVTLAASSPALLLTVTGAGGSTIDWYCTIRRKVAPGA